ncbi:hypothetical protein [Bradyrhizobium guangzhouense]|uniref:Uncharacterized protein n=1 Tax=Bradyrhizobium guangzhouense TaxID=1325095 RepID=A0AAE5X4R2_9BRAD|nr:hypothetical protein [Bradyrhizobium guangzhouense]QAU48842.1 hypothetical protein XH91_28130 [Bradyrhizobium guangzhouense]
MANVHDWRVELIEAHSALFQPPKGHPERASGYPWCEQGWQGLLERMCSRIEAALRHGERIHFSQVKEKFGELRVYWRGEVSPETADRIMHAISLARARSACTCEECGDEGRLYNKSGFYMTRCSQHAQGVEVPAEPGRENVHLVRRNWGTSNVYYAHYDRERDTLTELPPPSPKQEG